ncbi:hypothetical protein BDP27DRAFT_1217499 [Rhodocollybia butyracea]|uniref:C2H2-type domain-containing protein n=1 Tax=Rhodocollybia butyracea TaxID=206335 RepID=A0A9P5PZS4_9AGAR|nr:hypothetical protein BDP27DRAFT_1217499 [Rhodocollybia butyracea]
MLGIVSYTPSSTESIDESFNVFDVHFGDAVGYSNASLDTEIAPRYCHSSAGGHNSPTSSYSSSARTPSPSSETSSCPSDIYRRRFPCLLAGCSRRFTSQYTLKVHMEAHKPKPKVSFPCTEGCSEKFSRQHDRLRHEVAKHGKICEFSCGECGRFFSSHKTLGNHRCPVTLGKTRWAHS